MKKLNKIGLIAITLLIASTLIVSGTLMSYYINTTINIDSEVLLEYSETGTFTGEEQNAEDLIKTYDFINFCGNNTDVKNYWIRLNGHSQRPHTLTFKISDVSTDNPEGLTIALQWDNSGTWTDIFNWSATFGGDTQGDFCFQPSDNINFRLWVEGDVYLEEGDHAFELETIKQTPP